MTAVDAALGRLVAELPEAWLGGEVRAALDSGQAERCACAADLLTEAVAEAAGAPMFNAAADTVLAELHRIQGGAR